MEVIVRTIAAVQLRTVIMDRVVDTIRLDIPELQAAIVLMDMVAEFQTTMVALPLLAIHILTQLQVMVQPIILIMAPEMGVQI